MSRPGRESRCDHDTLVNLRRDLVADMARYPKGRRGWLSTLGLLATPQLQVIVIHRVSHLLHSRGWRRMALAFAVLNMLAHKATISPPSCISGGLYLASPVGILFHGQSDEGLTLSTRCVCFAGQAALVGSLDEAPRLGRNVTVATHGAALGPTSVGDGVRIGFNVALDGDAPANVLVMSKGMLSRATRAAATGTDR